MTKPVLTNTLTNNFAFSRPVDGVTSKISFLKTLTRIMFYCLSCTAIITEPPYAVAQVPGLGPAYNPEQQQQQGYPQAISQNQSIVIEQAGPSAPGFVPGLVNQPQPYSAAQQVPQQRGAVRYQAEFQPQPAAYTEVPAGTEFSAKLTKAVDSSKVQIGDEVTARLETPLCVDGNALVPAGSTLKGAVTEVTSARASTNGAPASVEVRFTSLKMPDGRILLMSASTSDKAKTSGRPTSGGAGYGNAARMGAGGLGYGMLMGMGRYGMYGMGGYGSTGGNSMVYMIPMMGMMGVQMLGGIAAMKGNHASEAKLSKGAHLQLKLEKPVVVGTATAMQPPALNQRPPKYGTAPITYTPAGYVPMQQGPADYAERL